MLLSLVIIFVFLYSIYIGVKRGLIRQLVMSIGFFLAYGFASSMHVWLNQFVEIVVPYPTPPLAEESPFALYDLSLIFHMDQPFYLGLSFLILLFIGWALTRIVGRIFAFTSEFSIDETISNVGGALLSFFAHYVGLFVVLFVISTLPFSFVQNQIESSWLAKTIITRTPELSDDLYNRWVDNIDTETPDIEDSINN